MKLRALAAAAALATLPVVAASQTAAPPPAPPPAAPPQALPPPAPPVEAPPPAPPPPQAVAPATPPPMMAPPPAALTAPAPVRWRGSFMVGAGSSYGASYFLVGARLGYVLTHGLAAEIEGQYWGGSSPQMGKIAPGLTWYSPQRLYAGVYYARWLVGSGFPDQDAVGGRVGLSLGGKGPASFAVGAAYEHAIDCKVNCDAWWPEASVGVAF